MIAAQVAGRPEGARATEVLLRRRAVAVSWLPGGAAAAISFLKATPRVHW